MVATADTVWAAGDGDDACGADTHTADTADMEDGANKLLIIFH